MATKNDDISMCLGSKTKNSIRKRMVPSEHGQLHEQTVNLTIAKLIRRHGLWKVWAEKTRMIEGGGGAPGHNRRDGGWPNRRRDRIYACRNAS